eukprot:38019-Rhodomonas_salina.3
MPPLQRGPLRHRTVPVSPGGSPCHAAADADQRPRAAPGAHCQQRARGIARRGSAHVARNSRAGTHHKRAVGGPDAAACPAGGRHPHPHPRAAVVVGGHAERGVAGRELQLVLHSHQQGRLAPAALPAHQPRAAQPASAVDKPVLPPLRAPFPCPPAQLQQPLRHFSMLRVWCWSSV